ncbi:HNH endonuclease signature motif containing protein [uncultured Clostridium sp.]|uniref:HNH endonuclease signature motif containing protein n=1 Tax=uncultured Clostridium sp. TaxID=59620 RepID=UPI0025D4C15A|nr:HNH endonuclease signature motif containing protein [uncultured Clostridium sp.]
MALSKLCSRCQCIILYGNRLCDRCTDKIGSYRSVSDKVYQQNRSDSKEQKVYKSATWKRIRAQAISKANGLCEECIKKGKISYYDDVHHKIPIKVDYSKAYDLNNLICLCRSCHIKAHKEIKSKGEGVPRKF